MVCETAAILSRGDELTDFVIAVSRLPCNPSKGSSHCRGVVAGLTDN